MIQGSSQIDRSVHPFVVLLTGWPGKVAGGQMDPQADWYIRVSTQPSEKTCKTLQGIWCAWGCIWGMTDDGYCFMVIEYGLGFSNFKDLA